ncbi:MAG: hypothetical protein ACMG6H_15365, partial [Acidobacteriota bacterium]
MTIDLSAFPLEAVPDPSALTTENARWQADRIGESARPLVPSLDGLEAFKAFNCDGSIKPQLIGSPIQLSLENNLTLVLDDQPGHTKHALEGSMALVGSAGLKLKAGFKGSGRCDAQTQIRIPVGGWFSVLVMPAVRLGLGAELEGEILLVQGELGVEGKVGFSGSLGWECGGAISACRGLDAITPLRDLKTKSKIPSANDMQAKVSVQFYVVAGLDAVIGLGFANAEILEARIGPKQSFDLAFEDDQAARPDYASSYDLKLEGVIEPGSALKKAIEKVIGDDSTTVKFEAKFAADISESPKGSLSVSTAKVRPGEPVDFTVDLSPDSSLAYFLLGYNVDRIDLYRKRLEEPEFTFWKSMNQISSNRATYKWVPVVADAGKYEFAAFVNTQIPVPLLEVSPNSIRPLEVSCFAASGLFTKGSQLGLQASTCADTWVGPATYVAKTPGLPTANIATRSSNITWTYDPTISGFGATYYTPTGSFDLAINHPDDCISALSPNTFVIVNDPLSPSRLGIFDNGFSPPTYGFGGSQLVNFTSTVSCPGKDP